MSTNENKILIVLVLYKTKLENSESYKTFSKNVHKLFVTYELLIYNNSQEIIVPENNNYTVFNAPQNNMLACAYNYALGIAIHKQCSWLLLLDQDTNLIAEYFSELNYVLSTNLDSNIAAIIPQLKNEDKYLSPVSYSSVFGFWGITKHIEKSGMIKNKTIAAFNSGSLFSICFLQRLNGFPEKFPLDMLDVSIFYNLSKNKASFYLLNVVMEHDLSVLDYINNMTKKRYDSILEAEYNLAKQIGLCCFGVWKIHLFLRIIKQINTKEKREYISETLKFLWRF